MRLDWKLATAFATGAAVACGIVYFSVKPAEIVPAPAKPQSLPRNVVVQTVIRPAPESRAAKPPQVPIREKPSPMPPPVRRDKPEIAHYAPPPAPAAPAPQPIENVPAENVSLPAAPKVETRVGPTVTLMAGSVLAVSLGQFLSSARNQSGDSFFATLTQPLVADGWVIAERGARAEGRVVEIAQSAQGAAHLEIAIVRVALSDGQTLRVHTGPYAASGSNRLFFPRAAEILQESRLTFRVLDPITVTEHVNN